MGTSLAARTSGRARSPGGILSGHGLQHRLNSERACKEPGGRLAVWFSFKDLPPISDLICPCFVSKDSLDFRVRYRQENLER
jgi:hypothetical protein